MPRTSTNSDTAPLIPRTTFFGTADFSSLQISPDGNHISYLKPVDNVMNVWVAPTDKPENGRPLSKATKRGIMNYGWLYSSKHLYYLQDKDGDEKWHTWIIDIESGEIRDIAPVAGAVVRPAGVSHKFPGEILLAINDRKPQLFDIHRCNIATGERKLIFQNDQFAQVLADDNFQVRLGMGYSPAGLQLQTLHEGKSTPFTTIGWEDAMGTGPAGFNDSGDVLYMTDSRGRDTSALMAVTLATGESKLLAEHPKADFADIISHPKDSRVLGATFEYVKTERVFFDEETRAAYERLAKIAPGNPQITSTTLDFKTWVVAFVRDDGPVNYYIFDPKSGNARFMFTNRKKLENLQLRPMHSVIIKARDGLDLVSYLTLPAGKEGRQIDGANGETFRAPEFPVPLVLNVHGGPWARDSWGYNSYHQWQANRGYAVLSVNFRGSVGFGKELRNKSAGEWAGKMHDDLIDAVDWAVKNGIADKDKVAIMGGSYGGYATLVGLTKTPDVFACGVDIVGPSNLITLLQNIPEYWQPMMPMMARMLADPRTPEGQAFLRDRSPLTHVEKIRRPLLIGQGANDPRVTQVEADQIVDAMKKHKIPVTYVLYPDEGHGFQRPPNTISFFAIVEAFLAEHLGGRYEPVGNDFEGSTVDVKEGADQVPGLAEALQSR
ncbi:MAG: S9 family peptidase [Planctomycetaceae bacterium]|nr:S9 family peptidase [Planctomycetaceae bacterium]